MDNLENKSNEGEIITKKYIRKVGKTQITITYGEVTEIWLNNEKINLRSCLRYEAYEVIRDFFDKLSLNELRELSRFLGKESVAREAMRVILNRRKAKLVLKRDVMVDQLNEQIAIVAKIIEDM